MQKTNLKLAPYFDDFDSSKNYQKILFKPGRPVQARELTQLQTQLQNQIENFANHTFKDGSVVIPGQVGYDLEYHAVLVQNLVNGIEVESYREALVGTTLRGQNSEVEAIVVNTVSVETSEKNALTLYVKYTKSGINSDGSQQTRFANNETLINTDTVGAVAVTYLQNATEYTGSVAYITNGIYYIRGYFVEVLDQTLILDQYSNKPVYKVGLSIAESKVSTDDDSTLFDNANGSTNFAAPGADRLKITATLSKELTSFSDNADFIELLRLSSGELEEIVDRSFYSELEKNLARRTFDESGNYTTRDFSIRVKEALNNGANGGVYNPNEVLEDGRTILSRDPIATDPENSINGDNFYTIEIGPGKAYVRGFEVSTISKKYVLVEKPRSSFEVNNKATNINFGQYLTTTATTGSVTAGEILSLRNSSNNNIGQARAISLTSGKLYLQDLSTYNSITVANNSTGLVEGDFIFNSRGTRAVVNGVTVSGSNSIIQVRQVSGKFTQGDVFSNSKDSVTYTISSLTVYTIANIDNIVNNGASFTATINGSVGLQSANKKFFVSSANLPTKSISDFSYTKLEKISKGVVGGEVSISVPNNFTPLPSGYLITSSTGTHTATASINGQTLVLSGISGSPTTVDIYYKLRVNNTSIKEKTLKTYNFLSAKNAKGPSFGVYGNRFDDKEINLKFPDVFKVHAIHEAVVSGVADVDMFDRVLMNSTTGLVVGDILKQNNILARVINIDGVTVYVKFLQEEKFVEGTNLTTQIVVYTNPDLVGRFLTEVVYGSYVDITENFALSKNDTEDVYRISKLTRLGNRPTPRNKITVVFDYFEHGQTNNDFFSVASYDTVNDINYGDIPYNFDGSPYTDVFDFRTTASTSLSTGTGVAIAPYVCSNAISAFDIFGTTKSTQVFPYPSEFISYDYNYYANRIDRVYLDKSGKFVISIGAESANPSAPEDLSNSLRLATLSVPAYLRDVKTVKIQTEDNKRYTMKDIGGLESRLDNVEYYTSLSLLETDTNNMLVLDSGGNNRFKNGFLVDNFKSRNFADTNNVDFKMSLDIDESLIRPYPYVNNVGLKFDAPDVSIAVVGSSILQKTGDYLTLPYTQVELQSNPYASRVVNLNPFNTTTWIGDFQINPSRDVWYDTRRTAPENVPEIDLSGPIKFLYDQSGADGNQWGSWNRTGSSRTGGGTNIFQQRDGVNNEFSTTTQNIEVGDRIDSVESLRFARSIVIDAFANRLKPNTEMYFFIDGEDSNNVIFPRLLSNVTRTVNSTAFVVGEKVTITPTLPQVGVSPRNLEATVVSPSDYDSTLGSSYSASTTVLAIKDVTVNDGSLINPTNPGDSITFEGQTTGAIAEVKLSNPRLTTNSSGEIHSFIIVPPGTIETGQSRFVLTDQKDNTTIAGVSDTNAVANYDSDGTLLELTSLSIDFQIPEITSTPISETRTRFIPDPPPPPPRRGDPLAQSFFINKEGGVFLSSIDVFFQSKDNTAPVNIDIRTIKNGFPTEEIVPLSKVTLEASQINVSSTASTATRFTFETPVYLSEGNDYCFVLRTRSLNYKVWVSRLNENDVTTNQVINKQPAVGSLFKSQNMSIWTPDQFEDIKFTINRCKFSINSNATANIGNNIIPEVKLPANSLYFTDNVASVTVLHPNHCMHTLQNYVDISGVVSDIPPVKLQTNITNQQFTVDTVITLSDATFAPSQINNAAVSASNLGLIRIGSEIIGYKSISGNTLTIPAGGRGLSNTTIVAHNTNNTVEFYSLNGIPLTEINNRHQLSDVIDMDRYKINTTAKANETIQSGGKNINASRNLQFESITPQFNQLVLPGTNLSVTMDAVAGASVSEKTLGTFSKTPTVSLENLKVNELDSSRVIISKPNQDNYGSAQSFALNTTMTSLFDNVSPLLQISGSSVITAMNRINKISNLDGTLNLTSELEPSGSLHDAVYITKKVNLETSATSVRVMFDAIRRQGSDIKVFVRTKSDDEIDAFNLIEYVEVPVSSNGYPISTDDQGFKAFDYEITGLEKFKEFAVKIVMISDNQSSAPKIRNFRSLALAV
jgi:hypothetical protein